jgi:hypothetical protein
VLPAISSTNMSAIHITEQEKLQTCFSQNSEEQFGVKVRTVQRWVHGWSEIMRLDAHLCTES